MYMLPIVWLFTVILARICSTYDSRNSRGKYVILKNKFLAKILIDKEGFWAKGRYTLQKDRNKMSIVGLAFYLCNLFIIVLTIVLMLLPQIPCAPFEIDTTKIYVYTDTVNTKIPVILTMILLCAEIFWLSISLFCYVKKVEQKWIKILIYVVSIFIFIICSVEIIEMVFELSKW